VDIRWRCQLVVDQWERIMLIMLAELKVSVSIGTGSSIKICSILLVPTMSQF
jgi:hypothetical protein